MVELFQVIERGCATDRHFTGSVIFLLLIARGQNDFILSVQSALPLPSMWSYSASIHILNLQVRRETIFPKAQKRTQGGHVLTGSPLSALSLIYFTAWSSPHRCDITSPVVDSLPHVYTFSFPLLYSVAFLSPLDSSHKKVFCSKKFKSQHTCCG